MYNMVSCKWLLKISRNYSKWRPLQIQKTILSDKGYTNFLNSLPVIVDKGVMDTKCLETAELRDRIKRISEYYMRGRKTIHGEVAIFTNEFHRKPEEVKGELQTQQYTLAWCVELLLVYFLIVDDFEDSAKTRNGKPCWHLLPDVGPLAGNDASMLRSFIFKLLKQNITDETFVKIIKLFNEVFFTTCVGQYMDAITSKRRNYNTFTKAHYKTIALYKCAYYSIKLPILSALILSNKYNEQTYKNVSDIFTDVGIWTQINNDFTDFYDDDTKTGKTGSDIQAGKCTWLAVTALERCNEAQRKEFESCYGSWEPGKVERIHRIYEELEINKAYFRAEETTYNGVVKKIKSLSPDASPSAEFCQIMLDKYYSTIICSKSLKFEYSQ